jgi:hypothetical protein
MIYDKASLVQIPSGYKSGTLYSVVPNTADGDFDFSRGSTATRVNKDGLIETVASNTPRLDYPLLDGVVQGCPTLLLEPSRTNLITYSEDFSQSYWNKLNNVTVSSEKVISPDGTLNASQLVFDGTANGRIEKAITGLTQGADYSVSIYARVSSGTQVVNFGSVADFPYTLTTEWQRLTSTQAENDTVGYPRLKCNDDVTIEVWGFQLEKGSYATSYIPTSGSTVTRTVDKCFNGGDADLFNDSEGVVFLDIEVPNNSSEVKQTSLNNGTTNEAVKILQLNGTTFRFEVVMGSGTNFSQDVTVNPYQRNKLALQYKANDYKVFVNGTKQSVTQRSTLPTGLDRFNFNRGFSTTDDFTGNVYQLMVFNEVLSDSELETITSYTSFNQMAKALLYTIE